MSKLADGHYIRDDDYLIIKKVGATIIMGNNKCQLTDNETQLGDYRVERITDNGVEWTNSMDGETITWTKVSSDTVRRIEDLIKDAMICTKSEEPREYADEVEPAVTLRDVNQMKVPSLKEVEFLDLHLQQFAQLGMSIGIIKGPPNGPHVIKYNHRVALMMKLSESLQELPTIEAALRQSMQILDYDFSRIASALRKQFCNRSVMKNAYKRLMNELKFTHVRSAEEFIAKASKAVAVFSTVADISKAEYKEPVREIVRKLPTDIRNRVICLLVEHTDVEDDWPIGIPFNDTCRHTKAFEGHYEDLTIVDIIRKVSNTTIEQLQFEDQRRNHGDEKQGEERTTHRNDSGKVEPGPRMDKFAEQFARAYIVYGPACREHEVVKQKLLELKLQDFLMRVSERNHKYFLVGSHEGEDAIESKLRTLGAGLTFRKFTKDPPRPNEMMMIKELEFTAECDMNNDPPDETTMDPNQSSSGIGQGAMTLTGKLRSMNSAHAHETEFLVDTGSGKSYLLLDDDESVPSLFPRDLKKPLEVVFGNRTTQRVFEVVTAVVAIDNRSLDKTFESKGTFFVIRRQGQRTENGLQVILGRDLIQALDLQMDGIKAIRVQNEVVFEQRLKDSNTYEQDTLYFTELKYFDIETTEPDESAEWGRLQVRVPWKTTARPPQSYHTVWTRDYITCKKLTPAETQLYSDAIKTLLEGGFAEIIDATQRPADHYIAVRPVFNSQRNTTKCRLCLDARTINDYTFQGNILGPSVIRCLITFRQHEHVAMFDICKAFWQMQYTREEGNWYCTILNGQPIRFRRMIFGANWSPSALEQGLRLIYKRMLARLKMKPPNAGGEPCRPESVHYANYVDDFVVYSDVSIDSVREATTYFRWFLRKFGFDSDKYLDSRHTMAESHTYLGYTWNLPDDTISPKRAEFSSVTTNLTVRQLVSTVGTFFDPLGLFLKVQLAGRMIVRAGWEEHPKSRQKWERLVSDSTQQRLTDWINEASHVQGSFKRKVEMDTLYVFSDASMDCWTYEVRDKNFELIRARGGMVPQKCTIPYAELLALYHSVVDLFKVPIELNKTRKVVFLTDSECNVHRLRRQGPANVSMKEGRRIQEIKDTLIRNQNVATSVMHIPGELNFADYPSRPFSKAARELIDHRLIEAMVQGDEELRFDLNLMHLRSATRQAAEHQTNKVVTATVEENDGHKEDNGGPADTHATGHEDSVDIDDVTTLLSRIRSSQEELLRSGDHVKYAKDSQGLFRCEGKIVIPDRSTMCEIIEKVHGESHWGIAATIGILKRTYVNEGISKLVKARINACDVCKQARYHRHVRTCVGNANWVGDISEVPLNAIVGIDLLVIDSKDDEYACCVTATCLISKFIRTERLRNQTTDELIRGLTRMFGQSTFPTVLVMDNASNFKSLEFRKFCLQFGITRCFNAPHASSLNGWIERSHQYILLGLRTLIVRSPSVHWSVHLDLATHLANCRPYETDDPTGINPLKMVFGIEHEPFLIRDVDKVTKLIQQTNLNHLKEIPNEALKDYEKTLKIKRKRLMEKYEQMFQSKREKTRLELLRKNYKNEEQFMVGSMVRVHRDTGNKVETKWSEPRRVVACPSASTRLIQRADGREQLEWIGNLIRE